MELCLLCVELVPMVQLLRLFRMDNEELAMEVVMLRQMAVVRSHSGPTGAAAQRLGATRLSWRGPEPRAGPLAWRKPCRADPEWRNVGTWSRSSQPTSV